jgi:hypothetical protein
MTERSPIFSAKDPGQQIGYTQGELAFDQFARPCATYEGATGLLRDPQTRTAIGYVSLNSVFVGCSSVAEKLFLTLEEATDLVERAAAEGSGDRETEASTGIAAPADVSEKVSEGAKVCGTGSPGLVESDPVEPFSIGARVIKDAISEDEPSNDQVSDFIEQDETFARFFSETDDHDKSPRDQRAVGEPASDTQRDPDRAESSHTIVEGLISSLTRDKAAPSELQETDRERSHKPADPNDSKAVSTVEAFMQRLADYLRSTDGAPETADNVFAPDQATPSLVSRSDEHNDFQDRQLRDPHTARPGLVEAGDSCDAPPPENLVTASTSTVVQDMTLPATAPEPALDGENRESEALSHDPGRVAPEPTDSAEQDVAVQLSFLEHDVHADEHGNDNEPYLDGPPTAPDQNGSSKAVQGEQITLDLANDWSEVELERTPPTANEPDPRQQMEHLLGAVLRELQKKER